MCERGTGRTTRQLAALPDGSWYLVANAREAEYCRRLLSSMGRARNSIKFATPDLAERHVLGLRPPDWDVDHAYFSVASRHHALRAVDVMWLAAGTPPRSDRVSS